MDSYNIYFRGYRREPFLDSLPEYSSIYAAYACVYNPAANKVSLKKLLFIGKAANLRVTLMDKTLLDTFKKGLGEGEELCFSYSEVEEEDLDVVENGLIVAEKPALNTRHTRKFRYAPSLFELEGKTGLFEYTDFSIE